jgi:hypothetical protein
MDSETTILTAVLAIGIGTALCALVDTLVKRIKLRKQRLDSAILNDCKPGCFLMNQTNDKTDWEDCQ